LLGIFEHEGIAMSNEELMRLLDRPTITIPEAGRLLDLSRNSAYDAAKRGEIPTLRFNKRIVVPTMALRRMLGLEQQASGPSLVSEEAATGRRA
jgi:hypothetical protein